MYISTSKDFIMEIEDKDFKHFGIDCNQLKAIIKVNPVSGYKLTEYQTFDSYIYTRLENQKNKWGPHKLKQKKLSL